MFPRHKNGRKPGSHQQPFQHPEGAAQYRGAAFIRGHNHHFWGRSIQTVEGWFAPWEGHPAGHQPCGGSGGRWVIPPLLNPGGPSVWPEAYPARRPPKIFKRPLTILYVPIFVHFYRKFCMRNLLAWNPAELDCTTLVAVSEEMEGSIIIYYLFGRLNFGLRGDIFWRGHFTWVGFLFLGL